MLTETTNQRCRDLVQRKIEFTANNIFSEQQRNGCYVVFSYGTHFPLFIYDSIAGVWFANSDKYSRSTSKHKTQAHPLCEVIEANLDEMNSIRGGDQEVAQGVLLRHGARQTPKGQ
jgi:hypothetical protein